MYPPSHHAATARHHPRLADGVSVRLSTSACARKYQLDDHDQSRAATADTTRGIADGVSVRLSTPGHCRIDRSRYRVRQGLRVTLVRNGHGGATHGAGRAARAARVRCAWILAAGGDRQRGRRRRARCAWILGLAVLVLSGAFRHVQADHHAQADHVAGHRGSATFGATRRRAAPFRARGCCGVAQAAGAAGGGRHPRAGRILRRPLPPSSRLLGLGEGTSRSAAPATNSSTPTSPSC